MCARCSMAAGMKLRLRQAQQPCCLPRARRIAWSNQRMNRPLPSRLQAPAVPPLSERKFVRVCLRVFVCVACAPSVPTCATCAIAAPQPMLRLYICTADNHSVDNSSPCRSQRHIESLTSLQYKSRRAAPLIVSAASFRPPSAFHVAKFTDQTDPRSNR
jgi:hypothetical protein